MQPDPGAPAPLRVVLVDADDRVRESLTRLLCIGDRIEVVGSASGAEPALDVVRTTDPDIVVIDPRLPGVDEGVALIRGVRAVSPRSRVLLLSGSDGTCAPDATELADGIVRKTFRATELLSAILGPPLLT